MCVCVCVCVCVCACICVCVCVCVCTCVHVHACVLGCWCVSVRDLCVCFCALCAFNSLPLPLCVWACACVHVHETLYLLEHTFMMFDYYKWQISQVVFYQVKTASGSNRSSARRHKREHSGYQPWAQGSHRECNTRFLHRRISWRSQKVRGMSILSAC